MHEWSLKWKKNFNHIKTADSKENSDKAVDVKGIEKKTREIPLIRKAVCTVWTTIILPTFYLSYASTYVVFLYRAYLAINIFIAVCEMESVSIFFAASLISYDSSLQKSTHLKT